MTHIKLYGIKPRIQYVADGILTTYDFPFVIFATTDVQVYLNDTLQDPKTYTISGIKTNGGTIAFTTPPSNGTIITITRDLSIERTTDFQEGGTLRADTLNDEFDYQTACLQQIADNINRSMILPPYAVDTGVDLTLPTPSAGKAIVWNADGTNLENSDIKINAISRELDEKLALATEQASIASAAVQTATEQAQNATEQAQIATVRADIATQKAVEASETLASKANSDLTNLSTTAQTLVANLGMPDYSAGIRVNFPYTPTVNGFMYIMSKGSASQHTKLLISGNPVYYRDVGTDAFISCIFPIATGQTVSIDNKGTVYDIVFYPCIGG